MSLNFQPEPPLVQVEDIPSCPIGGYLQEEADSQLPTTFFQVVGESNKVVPASTEGLISEFGQILCCFQTEDDSTS